MLRQHGILCLLICLLMRDGFMLNFVLEYLMLPVSSKQSCWLSRYVSCGVSGREWGDLAAGV